MCEYININQGHCKILKDSCPFVYFCNKINSWKPLKNMPVNCKIKTQLSIPKGYYKVCFERHGNLYVDIKGQIEIYPNPFDDVPLFIKVFNTKNGKQRLKKYEG